MSTSSLAPPTSTGRLTISSTTPGITFTVLDSALRAVTTTTGWQDQDLAPGVYLVAGSVGAATQKRLVTIAPGRTERVDLTVEFPAAAPTYGANTTNETHADLASALSDELTRGVGPDAGLVLVLRNLRGTDSGPPHHHRLELLDRQFSPVSAWPSDWVDDRYGGASARAARLSPGPYVLRTTREVRGSTERIDQTVWLSPGWQTLVFVANTPSGPDPRGLSVHMTPLSRRWQFDEYETRALEAALAGLRDGVASIDDRTAQSLLWGKFQNPMLGIVGLHCLMLAGAPDDDLADTVVANLRNLVGDHPDVQALALTRPTFGLQAGVSWPPMLERSWRACLLPADLANPGAVVDGSLAESIAPLVRIPGPWLRWTATDAPRAQPVPGGAYLGVDGPSAGGMFGMDGPGAPAPAPVPDDRGHALTAAVGVVEKALTEISAFREVTVDETLDRVPAEELAARTGLTTPLVQSCLRLLRRR